MSVIQRIRDKAAWIVFGAIALALIAFIVQDASVRRGSMFFNSTTVGKVNGEKIDKKDFEEKLDLIQQMQGAQGAQRDQLMSSVWDFMVNETVVKQEEEKLGLSFAGNEINDVLFGDNPPAWMKQQFSDPQTGEYKVEEAKAAFNQIKKQKNNPQVSMFFSAYIQPTIDQAMRQKYQALVTQAVYVPKWLSQKMNADNSSIANISYVYVPYSSVSDSTIKISDAEIEAYVKKNENQYKQEEETRTIAYVAFDASANGQDSANLLNQLNALKPEFAATTDVKAFLAAKGSELPFYDGYVTKSNMKMPNADSIMHLADGQVYGPYADGQNFTLAKMIGRRVIPDSVKVRHILIKTADQGQTVLADSIAKKRIDSIAAALKSGADFNAMVQKYSDDPGSKATKGEYEFNSTQFGNLTREFAEVAFYGNVGDKKVVKVESGGYSGYHYIEVLEQKNKQEAYQIAYLSKPLTASAETVSAASTAAQQFAANSRDRKQFEATAQKLGKAPMLSPEIRQNDFQVATLGNNRSFVKWIFENNVGDVSAPTEIGERYIVAIINSVNKAGLLSAQAARPLVETTLKNEKKAQQIIGTKFKGNTLEAYAQSAGTTVQRADSVSFQTPFIAGLGSEPKIVGAAFNKEVQNKASEPIAGSTGVFSVKSDGVSAKQSGGSPEDQRRALETNLKGQVGYRALNALRQAATVKDNRSKFY